MTKKCKRWFRKHDMYVVAIDRSKTWARWENYQTKDKVIEKGRTTTLFKACRNCDHRVYELEDEDSEYLKRALKWESHAIRRREWEQEGKIIDYDIERMNWLDLGYFEDKGIPHPNPSYEKLFLLLKRDHELWQKIQNDPNIKQEWNNLVIALKLTQ